MDDADDFLKVAPQQAKTCPNCAFPYIGFRCESCQWMDPDAVVVSDDDEEVDDPTDVAPTQPDLGGSD